MTRMNFEFSGEIDEDGGKVRAKLAVCHLHKVFC